MVIRIRHTARNTLALQAYNYVSLWVGAPNFLGTVLV